MFVCLFVCAGCRFNPPPALEISPKTDWCHALQLTPRAPSINQLPELGVEEMMFAKLAPSGACIVGGLGAGGRRGWRDRGLIIQNNGPSDILYSENTQKQVSENHVHSSTRCGGKNALIFLTF